MGIDSILVPHLRNLCLQRSDVASQRMEGLHLQGHLHFGVSLLLLNKLVKVYTFVCAAKCIALSAYKQGATQREDR